MDQSIEDLVVELSDKLRHRYYGKYRGLVEDVEDGESLGRITAKVPSVYGDTPSPWALPSVPFAGNGYGLMLRPEPGDGVWIEFEGGDPSYPIWTGTWWASREAPSDSLDERVLVTPAGLKIALDDAGRTMELSHPGGATITLDDKGITLKFNAASVVLSSTGVKVNDGAFEVR